MDSYARLDEKTRIQDGDNSSPLSFCLNRNYPNPFNPATEISFQTASVAWVTLAVHNSLGEKVAALVNDTLPPGRHRVLFDGKALPAGVYFYTLKAGEFQQTEKCLLIK
ncbi:T9SS type A sorting domain-containing protein [candidate division KSB1 bacterium]|nr:T9SS type A sorting domain-containing protein [candidate division KSB1 bacterium]RQW09118.1 MAG: T9SS C-terminal target domain-containing protein [candidate division KSB1 bacterium]